MILKIKKNRKKSIKSDAVFIFGKEAKKYNFFIGHSIHVWTKFKQRHV